MRLNGLVEIAAPPAQVLKRLADPATLQAMLPGEARVTLKSPGVYGFTLKKTVGFLDVRQSGDLRLTQAGPDRAELSLDASHLLAGAVALKVSITTTPKPKGTRIDYDGDLSATGLAGRLLRDREEGVKPYIRRIFQKLKAQIESAPSA